MTEKITLKQLKERVLNDSTLNIPNIEIIGIFMCDNKEYIYKILQRENDRNTN